jgi:hypothetical protein
MVTAVRWTSSGASGARRYKRARAWLGPNPCPVGAEACPTPSGSDTLLRGDASGGIRRRGTGRPLPREATQGQQLGRAMDRERAGSMGRAGRSSAGKRLTGFFISGFLIASNGLRHQP